MNIKNVNFDCKFFKGTIPCKPNKNNNQECNHCNSYIPIEKRILIIKLGAIGDVIRTTPLTVRFKSMFPKSYITWITHFPEVLPNSSNDFLNYNQNSINKIENSANINEQNLNKSQQNLNINYIDEILKFNFENLYSVAHRQFDIAINLDKEAEACALLADVDAKEKFGYIWDKENNHITAATPAAEQKLLTGLFDGISKTNKKHYLEEIFEICHLKFENEPYLLNFNPNLVSKFANIKEKAANKRIIGLNTGCGGRWKTRLWTNNNWKYLANLLNSNGFFPILLGGEQEDTQNLNISRDSHAFYPGFFSLEEFIALTSLCDGIVTQVSMMMHIATALQKPMVLINNIFNANEFYLYNRGIIIEPPTGCDCFYGNTCKRERPCMLDIHPKIIFNALRTLI